MASKISKPKSVTWRLDEEKTTNKPIVNSNGNQGNASQLKYSWTFWFDVRSDKFASKEIFLQQIQRVGQFSTYSDFWKSWKEVYAECPLPLNSNILSACERLTEIDIRMFKDGIEPVWEDPNHSAGGQFVITPQITNPEEKILKSLSFLLGVVVGEYGHDDQIVCYFPSYITVSRLER